MKKLKKFYDQRQLHWMVIQGVSFMIVFNYIPIYVIIIAFKNYIFRIRYSDYRRGNDF